MGMDKKPSTSSFNRTIAVFCAATLISANSLLWAEPVSSDASATQEESQATLTTTSPPAQASTPAPTLSNDQLKSLVAPIALYPDELLTQILVASTYPLEIVQAYQWVQQHPDLKGQDLTSAAQKQSWDPSVQALVAFPDVLKRLNQDVTWTTNLGNAFLAQQSAVMDVVQQLRANAEEKGKLATTEQQKVVNTTDNGHPVVEIEPANPDSVYIPDYDPAWIWGPAPEYYPYPYWYYPPRPAFGWCWWGPQIFVGSIFFGWGGWGGWGWHAGWYGHSVFVNNGFFVANHFNSVHFVNGRGGAVWAHSPEHRLGVAYPNRALASRFRPAGGPGGGHVSVAQARAQFNRSATHFNADRVGNRSIASGGYHNRSAFGGMSAGGAARAHSSRGYSSLGHSRGGSRSSGGGGHSSGGGGWGGGGGGGGGGHR
jgi:hypothetical protein